MTPVNEQMLMRTLALIDRIWSAVAPGPWTLSETAQPIASLPEFSEEAAAARAARGKAFLTEIDAIDGTLLPREVANTLAVARDLALRWCRAYDWYWLVFDPAQVGFFAMFAPTAYGGGFLLSSLDDLFARHGFASRGDVDRYLALVSDYARIVRQFDDRTRGQFRRGVVMPAAALDPAIELMKGLRTRAITVLSVAPERLAHAGSDEAQQRIDARIRGDVIPAFDALIAYLSSPEYRAHTPEAVGLSQYPGGREVYETLIQIHLTQAITVADVHAAGHARMRSIRDQMRALLDQIGFTGDEAAYLEAIKADPRWRAEGDAAIAAVFQRYIDRIAPHLESSFNFKPVAGFGVGPLPAALEGAMTFGFYDAPKKAGDMGRYVFNTRNLSQSPLMNLAALNYHELVPGHHFHIASQRENADLHPLRKASFCNAFNEGWAEYAAALAGEMGMYAEPEEKFGRLVMDAFLTCRLVVDTGMNAMGWSLEQAREYMRKNAFMTEADVASESIRYSCDIPAQSLAYKLGDTYLIALREEMKATLGNRFDLKDFHDAVLRPGALPLPLVKANVAAATAEALAMNSR